MKAILALSFLEPKMAVFTPLLALMIYLIIYQRRAALSDLKAFSQLKLSSKKNQLRLILLCLSSFFLIIALMRPIWGTTDKLLRKEGRSVVFILDISNSMRAEDVYPNRLEKSKQLIAECVSSLKDHRVGLIVFAGSASIKCPLTLDYDFFIKMLDQVNYDSVAHGGTRIEDALMKACDKLFGGNTQQYKDIILISDGGDQGELLDKAIETVNEKQIRLMLIGVGDEKDGSPIPEINGNGFMKYENKEIISKLESKTMLYISDKCNGSVYLPLGTKQMNLARIYRQISEQQLAEELSKNTIQVPIERYRMFLLLSFICFISMIFLPIFKTSKKSLILLSIIFLTPKIDAQTGTSNQFDEIDLDIAELTMAEEEAPIETPEILKALEELNQEPKSVENNRKLARLYINEEAFIHAFPYLQAAIKNCKEPHAICLLTYNLANAHVWQAKKESDYYSAEPFLNDAIQLYRKILLVKENFTPALNNLELSKVYLKQRLSEQKAKEAREKALEEALEEIKKDLEKVINDEIAVQTQTKKLIGETNNLKSLIEDQNKIQELAEIIYNKFHKMRDDFFSDKEVNQFPYKESQDLTKSATAKGEELIKAFELNDQKSPELEIQIINDFERALELLNQDQQQNQQDSEGESQDGEESDEYEESDEEGEEGDDDAMPDSSKMDLGRQELPPPSKNPQDIVKMEQELQKIREANKKPAKRIKVEKDW